MGIKQMSFKILIKLFDIFGRPVHAYHEDLIVD